MASTRSTAGSRRSRTPPPKNNSQTLLIVGGIAAVAVVVLMVLSRGGGDEGDGAKPEPPKAATNVQPAAAPAAAPVQLGAGIAGKTPARPAPPLTAATLGTVRDLEARMKAHYNDGAKARNAGDNAAAREHQGKAKAVLDEIETLLEAPLLWQEEADMGGWSQPAEYVEMTKIYGAVMRLAKQVRMGGG